MNHVSVFTKNILADAVRRSVNAPIPSANAPRKREKEKDRQTYRGGSFVQLELKGELVTIDQQGTIKCHGKVMRARDLLPFAREINRLRTVKGESDD